MHAFGIDQRGRHRKGDALIDIGILVIVSVLCVAVLRHAWGIYRQKRRADALHMLVGAAAHSLAGIDGILYESALSQGHLATPWHLLFRVFQNGFFFLSIYHATGLALELTEENKKAQKKREARRLLGVGWPILIGLYTIYCLSLFSVDADFQTDLDRSTLHQRLRRAFENHGVALSENATVERLVVGNRWLITDGNQTYLVRKKKRQLDISYRFQRVGRFCFHIYTGVRCVILVYFLCRIIFFYHRYAGATTHPLACLCTRLMEYTCLCGILYWISLLWPAERYLSPRPSFLIVLVAAIILYLGYVMPDWFLRLVNIPSPGEDDDTQTHHTAFLDLLRAKRNVFDLWIARFGHALGFSAARIERMQKAAYHLGRDWLSDHSSASAGLSLSKSKEWDETQMGRNQRSADYVEQVLKAPEISRIIRSVSERWDGKGAQDGSVGGESIPIESRVLAILEVFVSELYLTEDQAAALAHVWEGAGRQFDPTLVETLEALIEEEIKR